MNIVRVLSNKCNKVWIRNDIVIFHVAMREMRDKNDISFHKSISMAFILLFL